MSTSPHHDDHSAEPRGSDHDRDESAALSVVVGVDGSESNQDAVRWALAEARLLGVPLRLVHVVAAELDRAAHFDKIVIHEEVQSILHSAQTTAKTLNEQVTIIAEELTGSSPASTLINASRHAECVVVGRRGRGTFTQLLLGSVSTAVAARSLVPAVVVPPGWDRAAHEQQPVAVGIEGDSGSAALQEAFAIADRSSRKLHAISAWDAVNVYGRDTAAMGGHYNRWHEDALTMLDSATQTLRNKYPAVAVTNLPRHGQVVAELVQESTRVQCLVVGGRRHRTLTGSMIGSTSIGVLHHATSPVVVVHEP